MNFLILVIYLKTLNVVTLTNPVRRSRFRCRFFISPKSPNAFWRSSSCVSSWIPVTRIIHPSMAVNYIFIKASIVQCGTLVLEERQRGQEPRNTLYIQKHNKNKEQSHPRDSILKQQNPWRKWKGKPTHLKKRSQKINKKIPLPWGISYLALSKCTT